MISDKLTCTYVSGLPTVGLASYTRPVAYVPEHPGNELNPPTLRSLGLQQQTQRLAVAPVAPHYRKF